MKIFGDVNNVVFKIKIKKKIDDWVYGNFLLQLGNNLIGDMNDDGVHLKGCINWLHHFLVVPQNRCVPELMLASKEVVWRDIAMPPFESIESFKHPDPFVRFHLSHLGMSSFDQVTLVMINDGKTHERLLWQQKKENICDFIAPIGSLEVAAKKAITWFHEVTTLQ